MSATEHLNPLLRAQAIADMPAFPFSHPLNPNSEIHLRSLGRMTGLQRIGISIGRVPPGKESFCYHFQHSEEEFIYILSGRGIAEIGDEEFEVGPGDFMGFTAPSVGHQLKNPFDQDLVYLMGGENRAVEIADFPRLRKRFIRSADEIRVVDWDDQKSFWK